MRTQPNIVHAIAAEVAPAAGDVMPADLQWMPPGEHNITATGGDGKPITLTVTVGPETAELLQETLTAYLAEAASGAEDRPYFDLNHEDREASGHPTEFYWGGDDPVAGGVRARLAWTGAGEQAIRGKNFRRFSPSFFAGKAGEIAGAPVNMGGLVNRAAFKKIQAIWSKAASADDDPTAQQQQHNKPENEPTMKSLLSVLAKLGLTQSADADEATAITQVTARHAELAGSATGKDAQITELKAKLATTETTLVTARKAHAESVVEAACAAGRIPGQDAVIKAKWSALIEADPDNAKLLPGPNPALKPVVAKSGAPATSALAGGEHEFLTKAKAYAGDHKVSEAFAHSRVAASEPQLYDDYRRSLVQA